MSTPVLHFEVLHLCFQSTQLLRDEARLLMIVLTGGQREDRIKRGCLLVFTKND